MAAVTIGVVAKKAVEVLASSKKGRNFLLYTVGVVLFIVLLPLIAIVGLFGFLAGGELPVDQQQIMANLPAEDRAVIERIDATGASILTTFAERGLTENDGKKAAAIYMACLLGKDSGDVAADLAECFEDVSDTASVYDNVAAKFSVKFTAEEEKYFDDRYGVTKKKTAQAVDTSGFTSPGTKNSTDLVAWAKAAQAAGWGYVYGTYGTVLDEALLKSKAAQYPGEVGGSEAFIRKHWLGGRTADCVGLIKGYGWYDAETGATEIGANGMPDIGADTMYGNAKEKGPISAIPETPGLAVWHEGHIGIYIGGGEVIQAANTEAGVIKTKLAGGGWTHWLKIPYIAYG